MKYKSYIDDKGRVCTKCNAYKLFSEFAQHSTNKNGYHTACKECYNRLQREKTEREKINRENREATTEILYRKNTNPEYWEGIAEIIPSYKPIFSLPFTSK